MGTTPVKVLGATVLLAGILAGPLRGQPGKEDKDKVKVTVVVILAGEAENFVDPRLKQVADEVKKLNPHLKSFRLEAMTSKPLAVGKPASFPLIDGKTAEVVIKQGVHNNRVELAVTAPEQGEIVYRTVCGKFLPIVTRYQTPKNRERLILAVRVDPND